MKQNFYNSLKVRQRLLGFMSAFLITTTVATAQSFPTFSSCTFDNSNGGNSASILVAKNQSGTFLLESSKDKVDVYFGNNASISASGANEFEVGGVDITNNTGADVSQVYVTLKGLGFWTQNVAGTQFKYYDWNASTQSWTGTIGDGSTVTMRILGGTVNGVAVPMTDLQVMPVTNGASGYNFVDIPNNFTASFEDRGMPGGPTTHTASGTLSMPNSLVFMKLGGLAAGGIISDVRVKVGLYFQNGGDAWVNYLNDSPGSTGGDYDYYVQAETELVGTTYDYGDAPGSYGVARHEPNVCSPALYIGPNRQDYESSTTGSTTTDADDSNEAGYNDENVTMATYSTIDASYSSTKDYINNTGQPATFTSWIDWNNNGTFDSPEMATNTIPAGTGTATFIWKTSGASAGEGTIPTGVTDGVKIARFRLGSISSEIVTPTGTASNGEVEDMLLKVDPSLPVTLVKFDVAKEGNTVQLNWKTTSETNADYFDVQTSANAKNWISIGKVIATGESSADNKYDFSYTPANSGLSYYRLKMVDKDATFAYSSVKNIDIDGLFGISLFPNPASDFIQIQDISANSIKEIRIVAVNGKTVQRQTNNKTILDIRNLKSGQYVVQIISKDGSTSSRKLSVIR